MRSSLIAYVCGVDFQHEIGYCDDIVYYKTVEELKKIRTCWTQCGIVEVEYDGPNDPKDLQDIKSHKWVYPQMPWGDILKEENEKNV